MTPKRFASILMIKGILKDQLLTIDSISALNSKLLLGQVSQHQAYPGNIYRRLDLRRQPSVWNFLYSRIDKNKVGSVAKKRLVDEKKYKEAKQKEKDKLLEREIRSVMRQIRKWESVYAEITPVCDHAQGNAKYHRILPGFLVPCECEDWLNKSNTEIASYRSPRIRVEALNVNARMVLDFRGIKTVSLNSLSGIKPLFRMRQELLFEIQHLAGTHSSRPGLLNL